MAVTSPCIHRRARRDVRTSRALVIVLIVLLESQALAQTSVKIVGNYINQRGANGKQVLDESGDEGLMVYEPILFIQSQITPNTTIAGSFTADLWTSASEAIFDANSGASAGGDDDETKLQSRYNGDLSVSLERGQWTIAPKIGYSYEFDYQSINGGLSLERRFLEDNFVVSAGYYYFHDRVHPFNVTTRAWDDWTSKRGHNVQVSASQTLTPSDIVLLGYSYIRQDGALEGNVNSIAVGGVRRNEVLPDMRNRHAATLRYVHGFSEAVSFHGDYRYYFDDWGVRAHTIEPALYFAFADDAGLIKLYDRVHLQTGTDYYADSFQTATEFMTSDSELQSFTANEVGGNITYRWENTGAIDGFELGATALYYSRSNGLNAVLGQVSFGVTF